MLVPLIVAAAVGFVAGLALHRLVRPTHHRRGDRGAWVLAAMLLLVVGAAAYAANVDALAAVCTAVVVLCLVMATHPPARHRHPSRRGRTPAH